MMDKRVTEFYLGCLLTLMFAVCVVDVQSASSIDCYVCASFDGNNPQCDDPFNTNYTNTFLVTSCKSSRKNRNGVFPASACIKVAGKYVESGKTMVVRTCGVDSGTLTIDTEIVRMSHCGSFLYQGEMVSGCVSTCDSFDGCNAATPLVPMATVILITITLSCC